MKTVTASDRTKRAQEFLNDVTSQILETDYQITGFNYGEETTDPTSQRIFITEKVNLNLSDGSEVTVLRYTREYGPLESKAPHETL